MNYVGVLPKSVAVGFVALLAATEVRADSVTVELAALGAAPKSVLTISGGCEGGYALFQVMNAGPDLPGPVEIQLLRVGDATPLSKRSMRMKSGQTASFRLAVKKVGPGEFGVKVTPGWAPRDGDPDIRIDCR